MKALKKLSIAVMALMVLASCNKNKWIETDYSNDIVGTWTCVEAGYAEALVIKADGTIISTGLEGERYWEDVKGTYEMVNNKMTMKFEDNDNFEGRFEMIPGETMVLIEEDGERNTYRYCTEDLSEEIVGMWVCTETPSAEENDMLIMTYKEDGTTLFSGYFYEADGFGANMEASYKVIGDLLIHKQPDIAIEYGMVQYSGMRLIYSPNATSLGDVMSLNAYAIVENQFIETITSWLRVKQYLNLAGKKYDYSAVYVSNVSGTDEEFDLMGHTFSFAEMEGVMMDKILKTLLFTVEFPDANTIKYSCYFDGEFKSIEIPIAVEGNKVTLKMSENNSVYRDLDVYSFQDVDDCQLHMYMTRTAFVNFISNIQIAIMSEMGVIDITDTAAVEAVFNRIDNAIHSINLSFVMKS